MTPAALGGLLEAEYRYSREIGRQGLLRVGATVSSPELLGHVADGRLQARLRKYGLGSDQKPGADISQKLTYLHPESGFF